MHARQVTPMYLVEDVAQARTRYEALGFKPYLTEDDGCVGLGAGPSYLLLLNRDYARRTLPERAIALLEQRPALYIWVESLEASRAAMGGPILGELPAAGMREWAVECDQGLIVFAETAPAIYAGCRSA